MPPTTIRSLRIWVTRVLLFFVSSTVHAAEADSTGGGSTGGLLAVGFFLCFFLLIQLLTTVAAARNQQWFERSRQKYGQEKTQKRLQNRLSLQKRYGGAGLLAAALMLGLCWIALTSTPKEVGFAMLCMLGGLVLGGLSVNALRLAFSHVDGSE
jgi:hypothetical protein